MRLYFRKMIPLLCLFPLSAYAGLGDKVEVALKTDRAALGASKLQTTEKEHYKIHELSSGKMKLREYESNGQIFGLGWEASTQPDLRNLLGRYFSDFEKAARNKPRLKGRAPFNRVEGENVIVERSGHMRAMRGKAYARDLMPEQVSADEIQ